MTDKDFFYNQYKDIKGKFDYTYKGYNLKHLIPGYLTLVFSGDKPVGRDVFKEFYTNRRIPDLGKVLDSRKETVITYLINRTDYRDLALAAQTLYPDADIINLSELPTKNISCFSFTYIKHFFLSLWLILSHSIGEGLNSKIFYIALSMRIMNEISVLEKTNNPGSIKRYICFNSAYKEESLLTEYFKKRKAETITLQHGIFCDFNIVTPFDVINHENLLSDKLLCWGQSTIDYMADKGMDSSRFILEGNLKYKNIEIGEVKQSFSRCLVLLGRALYIDTNNKLLELLKEYNLRHNNSIVFYIKKHPFLMDDEHKKFADVKNNLIFLGKEHSVQEILKSDLVDFSISVNTTAYYESLALGKPCLRWTESENEVFYGMDDKFDSIEQFEERIQTLKTMPPAIIQDEVKKVIKYIFNPNLKV